VFFSNRSLVFKRNAILFGIVFFHLVALLFVDINKRSQIFGGCLALAFSSRYLLDYMFGLTTVFFGEVVENTDRNRGGRLIIFITAITLFIMGLRFLFGYWKL
jgi:hypothetical protein